MIGQHWRRIDECACPRSSFRRRYSFHHCLRADLHLLALDHDLRPLSLRHRDGMNAWMSSASATSYFLSTATRLLSHKAVALNSDTRSSEGTRDLHKVQTALNCKLNEARFALELYYW